MTGEPSGADRDLGEGRGRHRGGNRTRETAADAGTWCGVKRQMAEASGWQEWVAGVGDGQVENSPLQESRWEVGVQLGVTTTNGC